MTKLELKEKIAQLKKELDQTINELKNYKSSVVEAVVGDNLIDESVVIIKGPNYALVAGRPATGFPSTYAEIPTKMVKKLKECGYQDPLTWFVPDLKMVQLAVEHAPRDFFPEGYNYWLADNLNDSADVFWIASNGAVRCGRSCKEDLCMVRPFKFIIF